MTVMTYVMISCKFREKGEPQTELQRNQITGPLNWKMLMQTCVSKQ